MISKYKLKVCIRAVLIIYISLQGDSGGPLVCRDKRNVWTLAGITSWGPVDAFVSCKGISVFTEVSAFSQWIADNASGFCDS